MKKDIFSIPNILSFVRILLIPIFVWLYVTAGTSGEYYLAAAVVVASGITDFLDGQIARRCNMITEFGKFLDPLADKLTQGTLFLCIAINYPLMWILLAIWLLKDGFMAIMGLVLLKTKQTKLDRTLVRQGLHGYYLYRSTGSAFLPRSIPGGFACIILTHSYLYRCNASFRYSLFGSTYKDVASQ